MLVNRLKYFVLFHLFFLTEDTIEKRDSSSLDYMEPRLQVWILRQRKYKFMFSLTFCPCQDWSLWGEKECHHRSMCKAESLVPMGFSSVGRRRPQWTPTMSNSSHHQAMAFPCPMWQAISLQVQAWKDCWRHPALCANVCYIFQSLFWGCNFSSNVWAVTPK